MGRPLFASWGTREMQDLDKLRAQALADVAAAALVALMLAVMFAHGWSAA